MDSRAAIAVAGPTAAAWSLSNNPASSDVGGRRCCGPRWWERAADGLEDARSASMTGRLPRADAISYVVSAIDEYAMEHVTGSHMRLLRGGRSKSAVGRRLRRGSGDARRSKGRGCFSL